MLSLQMQPPVFLLQLEKDKECVGFISVWPSVYIYITFACNSWEKMQLLPGAGYHEETETSQDLHYARNFQTPPEMLVDV